MKKLKAWVISQRIVWAILLVASIVIPIAINVAFKPSQPQVTDIANDVEYDEAQDKSSCYVQIAFDEDVTEGVASIDFYNKENTPIASETKPFSASGNTLSATFEVSGKVAFCNVAGTMNVKPSYDAFVLATALIWEISGPIIAVMLLLFIRSMQLSCKVYYNDDDTIIVYAGYFYNYVSINGEKYDEHNTFTTFVPIKMSCNFGGMHLDATISLFRRIALKIDEKLRRPSDWI